MKSVKFLLFGIALMFFGCMAAFSMAFLLDYVRWIPYDYRMLFVAITPAVFGITGLVLCFIGFFRKDGKDDVGDKG